MKAFRIKGKFYMGDHWQDFTKELAGSDDASVREELYSRLGSKHRVKRSKIEIAEVQEIPVNEVTDPVTTYILQTKKTKTDKEPKKTEKETKKIKKEKEPKKKKTEMGSKKIRKKKEPKKRKTKKGEKNE